jgi:hypothetical protein
MNAGSTQQLKNLLRSLIRLRQHRHPGHLRGFTGHIGIADAAFRRSAFPQSFFAKMGCDAYTGGCVR